MDNKKICLVIDSMIDLPRDWAEAHNVKIIPTIIIFDNEVINAAECTAKEVFKYYNEHNKTLPETRPTPVPVFSDTFVSLIHRGYKIIYLSTTPSISENYQNALTASEIYSNTVYVVDTKFSSVGSVPIIHDAVKALQNGADIPQLLETVQQSIKRTQGFILVDDMNFIIENSNISLFSSMVARAFNIKPSMYFQDGTILPGKKFSGSSEKALASFIDYVFSKKHAIDNSYLIIGHTDASKETIQKAKELIAKHVQFQHIDVVCAGGPISSHLGKNAILFSYQELQ